MATAQRTAATALPKATIRPSPVDRTSRPPCVGDRGAQRGEVVAPGGVGGLVAVAVEARVRAGQAGEQDRDEEPSTDGIFAARAGALIPAG